MRYPDLAALIDQKAGSLSKGPVAIVMAENEVEIGSTVAHLLKCGFRDVILLAPVEVSVALEQGDRIHIVAHDVFVDNAMSSAINRLIDPLAGAWLHYCYNAEYLFFPFFETRRVGELLAFHTEERRASMLAYVIDLYAGDLASCGDAVSLSDAWLDKSGYYALARRDPTRNGAPKERQMDFFGGLRWRFEEHVPPSKRRIDRISLFRAAKGLRLLPDHTLNVEELNTYSCAWHNNLTAAICSFRTAKALRTNPGSHHAIQSFKWRNSVKFDWHSQQLMDLGLMEPGQWF